MIEERRYWPWAVAILGALTILRLALAGAAGLGDSEAYYWSWSRHLAPSYFDHPGMAAWMIRLTTAIGADTSFWVRLGPILLFNGTAAFVYLLGSDMFGPKAGFLGLVVICLTPVFAIGGISASPDTPLGFFWAAFLWVFWRALSGDRKGLAYLCGALLGLAFLSKYFAALLGFSAALTILAASNRRWLTRKETWLALLISLAVLFPILYFNFQTDFASFRFHAGRHGGLGVTGRTLGQLVGGELLYVSPLLLAGYLWSLWTAWKMRHERRWRFVFFMSAPTLVFFYLAGLLSREFEPHWPAMGYLPLAAGLGQMVSVRWDARKGRALFRALVWIGTAIPLLMIVGLHVHLASPVFMRMIPEEKYEPRYDLANELLGWDLTGRGVAEEYARMGSENIFVISYHYTMCSQLDFALRGGLPLRCPNDRADQFDFMGMGEMPEGADAVFVNDNRYRLAPEKLYSFDRVEKAGEVEIERGGRVVRRFGLFRCYGYRGMADSVNSH